MPNLSDLDGHKLEIVNGINNSPLPANNSNNGKGCNGSYFIQKYNGLITTVKSLLTSLGLSKVSLTDTTPSYLTSKLIAGTNITFTVNNPGAAETITVNSTAGNGGYTISETAVAPENSSFILSTNNVTSLIILRNYQSLGISILIEDAFINCTFLNDTDFDIPILNGSNADFVYMSNFPVGFRGAGPSILFAAKSRLNVYLVGNIIYLEGGIIFTAAGS